ncbi:MAG: hypothetical protein ACYC4Q_09960 [Victivallaceae bacterium]
MNLPLLSPGMCVLIVICACMMIAAAITLYLTRHKFKSSKNRKVCAIFALSVFGLVIAYILFYTVSNMIGRAQVQAQLAKMREQGIPLEKELILPKMPTNASDNGAYFYKAAFELMKGSSSYKTLQDMITEQPSYNVAEWSEQARNSVPRILKNQDIEQILSLFRQGAEKPYAVSRRYFMDNKNNLSELSSMRELFRLVSVISSSDGLNGNLDAGYSLIRDGLKTIKQFETDPFLISQLVNIACMAVNLGDMNALVSRYGISNQAAEQLLAELSKIDFMRGMSTGMNGEIMFSREILEKFMAEYQYKPGSAETYELIPIPKFLSKVWPFFYQDYACCLAQMSKIRDLNDKPYWAVQNTIKELENDEKRFSYSFMTKNLTIGLVYARTKVARIESEIDAAKLTLALHIYKNQHGTFPDKLEQLAPEILKTIPVDPSSGKPFEYQKANGKFTLSSVWLKEKEEMQKKQAKRAQTPKRNPGPK